MDTLTSDQAFEKLKKYCDTQDRCHQEVRYKLINMKIYGEELEEILAQLVSENYLNEERFARSYARGKFRIKKWGKNKIRQELKRRQINDYCIRKSMTEIDDENYNQTLLALAQKYLYRTSRPLTWKSRKKTYQYLYSKGFESELISQVLKSMESQ